MKSFFYLFRSPRLNTITKVLFVLIATLTSCISTELKVSEFKFVYQNENYTVRSAYCPGNPESCNQLMSNKFVALDMNQDRIIDKIVLGEVTLRKAQEVYDYCLTTLEKQNNLQKISNDILSFVFNKNNFRYEIKTFHSSNNIFNEFSISKDPNNGTVDFSVYIDRNADGSLNETVKRSFTITNAQEDYNKAIELGLRINRLQKVKQQVVVK